MKILLFSSGGFEAKVFEGNKDFTVVRTGIGIALSSAISMRALLSERPDLVLNVGSAGGFSKNVEEGKCYAFSSVSCHDQDMTSFNLNKGETLDGYGNRVGKLPLLKGDLSLLSSSSPFVEDVEGFDAGDMECYGIALSCSILSIPCASLKLITDVASEKVNPKEFSRRLRGNIENLYQCTLSFINAL